MLKGNDNTDIESVSASILHVFTDCSPGLKFKVETTSEGALQFLDLNLHVKSSFLCNLKNPQMECIKSNPVLCALYPENTVNVKGSARVKCS